MNSDLQKSLGMRGTTAAAIQPPAMIAETPWDILLALYSDNRCDLSLARLAALVSIAPPLLHQWLAGLEQRQLISGATNRSTGELRAVLTVAGRDLLDRYLSATSMLQVGTH
jgi:DNA-binding MarR family transcriptional regulator